jgi:hypothetical protein
MEEGEPFSAIAAGARVANAPEAVGDELRVGVISVVHLDVQQWQRPSRLSGRLSSPPSRNSIENQFR